ncbi:FkbM family methyltransferase [Martelella soudanensis]|uniref:FkbM family methyltransferase n=1 Tax=unclassified Martelella TaxID=2629616 RepID=UPI0015DFA523|nr:MULTISPECIES: FkbM family methyltransferase [unclassified Martelella]
MHTDHRRFRIIERHGIDLVLDVGANVGQFAQQLRQSGYQGRIVSFEPMTSAFSELKKATEADERWTCIQSAIGEEDGFATINISENSFSSSILKAEQWSMEVEPSIRPIAQEKVRVQRLDHVFDEVVRPSERVFLKIDTQGFELPVIRGALGALQRIALIQLEVSFKPVYADEQPVHDVLATMAGLGYRIVLIGEGWEDPQSAELLQADFMFTARRFNSSSTVG